MRKLVFLFTFISSLTYGQCADYDKLKTGGTYFSKTNNYIPFEIKYKDSIYHEDIFYPYDMKNIEKYSNFILSKAKKYIIKRAGENFFKNIQLEGIEVNYPEEIKVEYDNSELYKLENYDVKYWVLFTYKKNTYNYAFGLFFDKKGHMISKNVFPDISKNQDFENYINPCNALNLVKNDKNFKGKKINYIKLVYLDEINSFCWLVKEEKLPTKAGVDNYTLDSYYVNANSNKLEKIIVDNVTVIVYGTNKTK